MIFRAFIVLVLDLNVGALIPGCRTHSIPVRLASLTEVLSAADQVPAALFEGALQDPGIGEQKVGRRDHVQDLPRRELDHSLVRLAHAAQAGGGVVPPLLLQKKSPGR
jgi:hypothetical protein